MPQAYVKKLAKKHHMSISKAEGRWRRAKKSAAKQGHEDEYDYITGIFKHMMGEGYPVTFKDFYEMKVLREGTWTAPQTKEKAEQLLNVLSHPLPVKKADSILYNLIGDDDLFDAIDELKDKDPNADARPLVVSTLRKWISNLDLEKDDGLNSSQHHWRQSWDPEAVGMLRNVEDEESFATKQEQKSYLKHRHDVRAAAIAKQRGEEDEEDYVSYQPI